MITISDRGYWITGLIVIIGIVGQWYGGPWPAFTSQCWTLPAAALIAAVIAERAAIPAMRLSISRKAPQEVYLGEGFINELVLSNNG